MIGNRPFKSDREGEYFTNDFSIFFEEREITYQSSDAYTTPQNFLDKRRIKV